MSIRIIAATVAALGIAGCAMTGTENAGGAKEMKLAFDFTDGNPAVLLKKLRTLCHTPLRPRQSLHKGIRQRGSQRLSWCAQVR